MTDPNEEPVALPIIGQAVVVGGSSQVSLVGLTSDVTTATNAGDTVTVTATAYSSDEVTLYYQFYYCANYGTDKYETTAWTLVQDYSTSNSCQYVFPKEGEYIIVARAVTDPASEPAALPITGGVVSIGQSDWINFDDFNDDFFDDKIWYQARNVPAESNDERLYYEERNGRLYCNAYGDGNVWIGVGSQAGGVQAELELTSETGKLENSDVEVGLAVVGTDSFLYNFRIELSSSNKTNQAEVHVFIEDDTDTNNPDADDQKFTISSAQFDQRYTFSIIVNGRMVEFYQDDVKIKDADISLFDFNPATDLSLFLGCWGKYDSYRVDGYIDNVKGSLKNKFAEMRCEMGI